MCKSSKVIKFTKFLPNFGESFASQEKQPSWYLDRGAAAGQAILAFSLSSITVPTYFDISQIINFVLMQQEDAMHVHIYKIKTMPYLFMHTNISSQQSSSVRN